MRDRRDLRVRSRAARDQTWEMPLAEIVRRRGRVCRWAGAASPDHEGWEIRLEMDTLAELGSAREALHEAGLQKSLGRPYTARRRLVLPVLGRSAVLRLLRLAWGAEAIAVLAGVPRAILGGVRAVRQPDGPEPASRSRHAATAARRAGPTANG